MPSLRCLPIFLVIILISNGISFAQTKVSEADVNDYPSGLAFTGNIENDNQSSKLHWLAPSPELHRGRLYLLTGSAATAYTASMVGLNYLWYADFPRSAFHFQDDLGEWLQIDKMGHIITTYQEAYFFMKLLQWAGVEHRRAAVYGGLTAFMVQNPSKFLMAFQPIGALRYLILLPIFWVLR